MNRKKDLQDLAIEIANKAYKEFLTTESMSPRVKEQENLERVNNFIRRESIRRATTFNFSEKVLQERMIGPTNDIKDQPPLELARKRGVPVARIHEFIPGTQPSGFGTGFLAAPNLLITNHHVFPSAAYAEGCAANFLHEKDQSGRILQGVTFMLRPDLFFYNFEELDFALVYVEENATDRSKLLASLGCLPMIGTLGKVIKGSPINIIEYPMGGYKKYAYENNTVTETDDEKGIIQYTTDTQPAASGSPAFNNAWEVVALHYTGIPYQVDGKWMTTKGQVWDRNTMPDSEINWIANAGKSVSMIVTHLSGLQLPGHQQTYINSILRNSADPLLKSPAVLTESIILNQAPTLSNHLNSPAMDNSLFNFTGNNTININVTTATTPAIPAVVPVKEAVLIPALTLTAVEKALRFDENYAGREGYDEDFLGDFKVPLPFVTGQRKNELFKAIGSTEPLVLKYHHYSLVLNKKRRFQMWSAVNVNYSKSVRDDRDRSEFGNDSKAWRLDPRVPPKYQVQADEFYDPATLVDKGHIVRRDDNCWGNTPLEIEYSNSDTFHWLNCLPQHEQFNRDMFGVKGLWGVVENAIKSQLNVADNANKDFNQKACVLAGPVLDDTNDPEYNDVQYPLNFWKVFVIVSETDGPLVYGFLLSQEDVVAEFGIEKEGRPRFSARVKAAQVSLQRITELSDVSFDNALYEHDVLGGADTGGGAANESLRPDLSNFKGPKKGMGASAAYK